MVLAIVAACVAGGIGMDRVADLVAGGVMVAGVVRSKAIVVHSNKSVEIVSNV